MSKIRNCYIPRKGMHIFDIDYSGLELAVCANQLYKVTGYNHMLKLFNVGDKPVDPHAIFGAKLMSISQRRTVTYDEFIAHKSEPLYKKFRNYAKAPNLSFPGGVGYDVARVQMMQAGIFPKWQVLKSSNYEPELLKEMMIKRKQGYAVRVKRVAREEWVLAFDELVFIKQQMMDLYKDLGYFLKHGHKKLIMPGVEIPDKDEIGDTVMVPAYEYHIDGVKFSYKKYQQACNGLLMQAAAAAGAKRAVNAVCEKYMLDDRVNILAFIHDQIVGEVVDTPEKYDIVKDIAHIMVVEMQKVIPYSRVAVEMELKKVWDKEGDYWKESYWRNVT
jgi:hypothetical protein